MKQKCITYLGALIVFLIAVTPVSAHVAVKPAQVGVGSFQPFTVGVPNEKEMPVVALRLVIPEGLHYVSPNVKAGWTITTKKHGEGESTTVTEISWVGGSIPAEQRDEFLFSAQVPATETSLSWKAYQTYQDGTVVSWDQIVDSHMSDEQKEAMEKNNLGPASQTKIINDLNTSKSEDVNKSSEGFATQLSVIAIALSCGAIGLQLMNKKK